MSDTTHAATAVAMANGDALLALIAVLSASGNLDSNAFRQKLREIQDLHGPGGNLNQVYYEKTISNLIGAAEGRL